MLRIALCDDETAHLAQHRTMLENYLQGQHITARVQCFSDSAALLHTVTEEGVFDLYLLDIVMPRMSGIDLGLALRQRDPEGVIIYLSSSAEFAIDGYQARAFQYLLKPITQDRLAQVLEQALQQMNHRGRSVQVKTRSGLMRLACSQLLYAELRDRHVCYHLQQGQVLHSLSIAGSFKDAVAELLAEPGFLRCGSSFVVNLEHIQMVHKTGAVFSDGSQLLLPKTACATLRSAWSDYWLERGN